MHGVYQCVRDAAKSEAAGEEGGVGLHVFKGGGGGGEDLVDFMAMEGGGEGTKELDVELQFVNRHSRG